MTQLMDPWDFVSDYVNNLLKKREGVNARIDQFKYEDPRQLLLKIMNESVKFMSDDPIFVELFDRCNRQYDFLKQLEEESMEERFEELEEQFEEKSTKHQDVKFFVTSEKDNDTKQSSLKKFLAERDDNWKTPEQKVAAEDLSGKQTEVENERASEQTCMQILGDLYQAIGEKVSNGGFTKSGGHQAYKDEVERMEMEYASVPNQEKGPCGEASLILFKRDKIDPQLSSLLQTDEALTEELRRQEVLKKEVEDKEKKRKAAEEKNKDLARQQEEMKKNFEEKARLMEEDFKRQEALMQETLTASRKDMK